MEFPQVLTSTYYVYYQLYTSLCPQGINRTILSWLRLWDEAVFHRPVPLRHTSAPGGAAKTAGGGVARDKVGGAGSEGDKGGGVPSKGKKFEKRFEYQNPEMFASAEVSQMYSWIRLCWNEWIINFYRPPPPSSCIFIIVTFYYCLSFALTLLGPGRHWKTKTKGKESSKCSYPQTLYFSISAGPVVWSPWSGQNHSGTYHCYSCWIQCSGDECKVSTYEGGGVGGVVPLVWARPLWHISLLHMLATM